VHSELRSHPRGAPALVTPAHYRPVPVQSRHELRGCHAAGSLAWPLPAPHSRELRGTRQHLRRAAIAHEAITAQRSHMDALVRAAPVAAPGITLMGRTLAPPPRITQGIIGQPLCSKSLAVAPPRLHRRTRTFGGSERGSAGQSPRRRRSPSSPAPRSRRPRLASSQ